LDRLRATLLAAAILAAPFIALLFRTEAGLFVMAVALGAGSYLLAGAFPGVPERIHRWLRLAVGINLALAAACIGLAVWLVLR
jgi:hypothetical protein